MFRSENYEKYQAAFDTLQEMLNAKVDEEGTIEYFKQRHSANMRIIEQLRRQNQELMSLLWMAPDLDPQYRAEATTNPVEWVEEKDEKPSSALTEEEYRASQVQQMIGKLFGGGKKNDTL